MTNASVSAACGNAVDVVLTRLIGLTFVVLSSPIRQSRTLARPLLRAWLALGLLLGMGVTLPANAQPPANAAPPADWIYTVRPNDNIWTISRDYLAPGHAWHELLRYNQLDSTDRLRAGSQIHIPIAWLQQQPEPAIAQEIHGDVRVRRVHASVYVALSEGDKLNVGDEIRTGKGSVLVRFADNSLLDLREQSVLVFNTLSRIGNTGMVDTRTRLLKGTLNTDVQPQHGAGARYEIATPSAVAAVRGTQFRLQAEAALTRLEVTQGVVQLNGGNQSIAVAAGFGAKLGPSIHTSEATELLPAPETDAALGTLNQLPWHLQWKEVKDADHYQLDLFRDNQHGELVQSQRLDDTEWTLNQLNNGTYWLALRAVDSDGFQGQAFTAPLRIQLHSEPAILMSPLDDATLEQSQPQFSWQLSRPSDVASLELATNRTFQPVLMQMPYTNESQSQPSRSLKPGRYYWRVATLAGGNHVSYSPVRSFARVGKLTQTEIIAVNYYQDQIKLFWKGLDETQEFVVQVASDRNFEQVLREEKVKGTSVSIRLPEHTRYFARVKGVASEYFHSEFSAGREIELP